MQPEPPHPYDHSRAATDLLLNELSRRTQSVEEAMLRIETKLDSGRFLTLDLYTAKHEALANRVTILEDSKTWLTRAVGIQFFVILAGVLRELLRAAPAGL